MYYNIQFQNNNSNSKNNKYILIDNVHNNNEVNLMSQTDSVN